MLQALIIIGGLVVVGGLLYAAFWLILWIAPVLFLIWLVGHLVGMSMTEVTVAFLVALGLIAAGYWLFTAERESRERIARRAREDR